VAAPTRETARRLAELLRPALEGSGVELDDVTVTAAGRRSVVRVVVDSDTGVSLDEVAEASRLLSEELDRVDEAQPSLLAGAYVLEVSSPGVDRPLTEPRHWRRNVRRLVTAHLREGAPVTGRVVEAGDDAVVLDVDGTRTTVSYADVAKGSVQVEFKRDEEEAP
jgi:ribosome maturation factor RimP